MTKSQRKIHETKCKRRPRHSHGENANRSGGDQARRDNSGPRDLLNLRRIDIDALRARDAAVARGHDVVEGRRTVELSLIHI